MISESGHRHINVSILIAGVLTIVAPYALAQPSEVTMYDNILPPARGGVTVLDGTLRIGGDEIGDDLDLVRYEDGRIGTAGWSLANLSTTETIRGYFFTLRWYNRDTNQLLGAVDGSFGNPSFPIGPGQSHVLGADLGFRNIPIAPRMSMTFQVTEVIGGTLNDVGVLTGGPNTAGSSSRFVRNFTTGQMIDLGSSNRNLGFLIYVRPIPTPSALGIFGLATVFAARRRR
jgi:hypothetical protein